ncbi:MAG: acyltransferase 3 [Gammaproteobacteria bacterium]|jgi:peptidoglycan/LPS O-acetylase OafA/YrhL|nr:acyltransferase 3 [Gammaproteobacteria bacterium]
MTPDQALCVADGAVASRVPAIAADAPFTVAQQVRHVPSLDGLRALSFLLVFVGHVGLDRYVPGGFGVTVFFFLSGFLITTLLRAEFARNGSVDFGHFWLRRALRILPPFYLVLCAATLTAAVVDPPGTLSGPAVAARALHVTNYWLIFHGYAGEPPGSGVYWSLAVEEHFYLLFPIFYLLLLQKLHLPSLRQAQLLWILCALVLLWRCVLVFIFHASADRTYMASDTRLDSIIFGCALAVWKNPVLDAPVLRARWWKYVVVPGALLVLAGCLLVRSPAFRETGRYSLEGIALTFIFVAAIRFHDAPPFRILNWRPLAFVGVLSYSLYLLHYAVILGVQRVFAPVHPALQALLALSISLGAAWLIHLLVEQPCARLRKRLTV